MDGAVNWTFVISASSSGGILARVKKWARVVQQLGHHVSVVSIRDVSSMYYVRPHDSEFAEYAFEWGVIDSLSKRTVNAEGLSFLRGIRSADVILSSQFAGMHAVAERMRLEGWAGCWAEVVPADDTATLKANNANLVSCDLAIAVSRGVANAIGAAVNRPGLPVVIAPGGCDVHAEATAEAYDIGDAIRICYVGRLDNRQKRIFDLAQLAGELSRRQVKGQWTVVGDGVDGEKLKHLFADRADRVEVTFTGLVGAADLVGLLRAQHVFVLPSAFEGFSNALCEAAEAGLVPVATRVSGNVDLVDQMHNGFLVDVGDVSGMADAIEALASSPDLWKAMSGRVRQRVTEEFSAKASVVRVRDVVAEIIQGKNRSPGTSCKLGGLEHWCVPDSVTRCVRFMWRKYRGRPWDVNQTASKRRM